ncbi:MAG: recombinase [Stutzerimonas stutzeri]|nr:MAG: recombinase [Stutzerimonas stutzeri]
MSTPEEIAKALGELGVHDEESTVKTFLSTGYPELDHALSNGWENSGLPVGRMVEIYGPESSGKTAIATQAMIAAQRLGGFSGFNDHERSFQQYLAEGQGLDPRPGRFSFKKPKTFEDSLAICVATAEILRSRKLIPDEAPIAWVFDSLASMVPRSALYDAKGKEKDPNQRSMHDNTALARATSAHMPAFAQHCDDLGICAIFLNQIRLNIGVVYGNPETTPGGKSPKFYFSQRIALKAARITKGEGENAEVIGSQITAKVIKNKIARPFRTATYRFEFQEDGTGKFNVHRSLLEFLVSEKILKKPAAHIEWTDGKKYYANALTEKLEADPTGLDQLKALLPAIYTPPVVAEVETDEGTLTAAA